MRVPQSLKRQVAERARHCCEYCRLPEYLTVLPFQPDHILAEQHGGPTSPQNLGWACIVCNKKKGPNIASVDPDTNEPHVPLFNPRRDSWAEHFQWDGPFLRGRTPIGRATVRLLDINTPRRVALRARLMIEGLFPPP